MNKKEICKHKKNLKEKVFLGGILKDKPLFCDYAAKNGCPYRNGASISWEDEINMMICLSKGFIKRMDDQKTKKTNYENYAIFSPIL